MSDDSVRRRANQDASGIAAVVVTGTWLAMLLLDFPTESSDLWLAVMLFGYIAVVPAVSMLFDDAEDEKRAYDRSRSDRTADADAESDDALEQLRRRYANGELTDEQFERKLERLLETETLEEAESHARRSRSPKQDVGDRDSRDRSMERE